MSGPAPIVDDIDAAFGPPPESASSPSPESPPAIESRESPPDESAPEESLDRAILNAFRAVDNAIIAGGHLGHWLRADHPPATASLADGLRHYAGPGAVFDLWAGWRALELLRCAWTGKLSGVLPLAAQPPPEPDEAPGIVPPPAPPELQQRLGGIS